MLPQQFCDKIRCKITVKGPDSETPNFSYEGKVSSYELTREQVLENGQYLHLMDGLIKPFKKGNANTLFSYKVEVETDTELEREMYKLLTASATIKSESIQIWVKKAFFCNILMLIFIVHFIAVVIIFIWNENRKLIVYLIINKRIF